VLHGEGGRRRGDRGAARGEDLHPLVKLRLLYPQTYVSSAAADSQRVCQVLYGLHTRKYKTEDFCAAACFRFHGILLFLKSCFCHGSKNIVNGTKEWDKALYSQDKPPKHYRHILQNQEVVIKVRTFLQEVLLQETQWLALKDFVQYWKSL